MKYVFSLLPPLSGKGPKTFYENEGYAIYYDFNIVCVDIAVYLKQVFQNNGCQNFDMMHRWPRICLLCLEKARRSRPSCGRDGNIPARLHPINFTDNYL